MTESTVAIVGSGVAATAIAVQLTEKGHDVVIFEKGPEYPYPHATQFQERIKYLYNNPRWALAADLKRITLSGDYSQDFDGERGMVVGGSATHWHGMTPRMIPSDFRTRTLYGFGDDWPISYDEIESYYCSAETFLGISGTDADNPFAPPRSRPFPLPPFELGYGDRILAERLRERGIILHTTPQARARHPYDGRPGCHNFGTCAVCPIGARYSPNHHLLRLQAGGLCRVMTNTSVRRIALDAGGRARAVVYQPNDAAAEIEHAAKVIIVAAGAIESARLLLLSTDERHPDGIGNGGGQVGRNLTFHHTWFGAIQYKKKFFPGRVGPVTAQTYQYREPPMRGKHGGVKVAFSADSVFPRSVFFEDDEIRDSGEDVLNDLKLQLNTRFIGLSAETVTSDQKRVTLSEESDRFGDPFAHVQYESSPFDYESHRFAQNIFQTFAQATNGTPVAMNSVHEYSSGAHHMGTCRMGRDARDSVVDAFGRVHGVPNLIVAGSSVFVGTSGAANPTLTLVALALRTADYISRELL